MRKIFVCCIVLVSLTACRNSIGEISDLNTQQVGQSLLNSLFHRVTTEATDTAAIEKADQFNFFLRDGFARKFGF